MDRNNVLKPCPRCGREPDRNGRGKVGGVLCRDRDHFFQVYGASQDEADALWNARIAPAILTQSHKALGALLSADIVDPTSEVLVEAWSAYKAGEEYLSGAPCATVTNDEVVDVLEKVVSANEWVQALGIGLAKGLLSRLSRAGDA